MKIKDIREIYPILKRDCIAIWLDTNTTVSYLDDGTSIIINKESKKITVPGLDRNNLKGFTLKGNMIINIPITFEEIIIIPKKKQTYVIQASKTKIDNKKEFKIPFDLKSFFSVQTNLKN